MTETLIVHPQTLNYYNYNTYGLLTRIKTGNKITSIHIGEPPRGGLGSGAEFEQSYIVDSAFLNYRYAYDNNLLLNNYN